MARKVLDYIKAKLGQLKPKNRTNREKRLKTVSHLIMAGVMLMYFVGVALGVYATIALAEPVKTTLDYIMELAFIVGIGYFVKSFGENIAGIVLSYIVKLRVPKKTPTTEDTDEREESG